MRTASETLFSCPANGDLHAVGAFDAMLKARASRRRELVILILGHTNGRAQVTMRGDGVRFVEAQISSLAQHGIANYLVLSLNILGEEWRRREGSNNVCTHTLRARGVCCAYSSIGMPELASDVARASQNNSWGMFSTHPYLLFLQRWWFTTEALARGYSVLSLDADLGMSRNPLELVHSPALQSFDILFQGDGFWPVRQRRMDDLTAASFGLEVGVACARPRRGLGHLCTCGATAAPGINTGFVYARAVPGAIAVFNASVQTVLSRLAGPPVRDSRGIVHQSRLWPQAVMNEVVHDRAMRPDPQGVHSHSVDCHPADIECKHQRVELDAFGVLTPRAWWIERPRKQSVWLASELMQGACQGGDSRVMSSSPLSVGRNGRMLTPDHDHLLAHTQLESGVHVAVLPRTLVGRLCGAKLQLSPSLVDTSMEQLSCSALSRAAVFGMHVQHVQMTSVWSRVRIFDALQWWKPSLPWPSDGSSQVSMDLGQRAAKQGVSLQKHGAVDAIRGCGLTLAELVQDLPASARFGVLIGTATVNYSILCVRQGGDSYAQFDRIARHEVAGKQVGGRHRNETSDRRAICPCCWIAPAAISHRRTACREWNPNL